MTTHDVISAFLDNEPFDTRDLAAALASDDGRAMLIDLVALRHLVVEDVAAGWTAGARPPRRARWFAAAAAAVAVASAGGYAIGHRSGQVAGEQLGLKTAAASDAPPAPTRVLELKWQDANGGH